MIKKYPSITLEIDTKQSKNLLGIRIKANNTPIGYLALKWNANQIVRTDGKGVSAALANNPRTLVYETISSRYATRESSIGNSSYGARGMILYDARSVSTQVDRNMVGGATKRGLEEYTTTQGIGFGEGNSGLLEFASGAPIGSAQMGYATYSMIQLGDPVVSLSKIQNTSSNFDRTLGVKIAGGPGSRIESYHKFDYNKDGQEDIIVFYDDGKAELLQNFNGTYRNLGYVVYVIDAGKERKAVGDFRGDGYSDIVMTDTKGRLILLDNQSGKFVRIPVRINNLDGTEGSIK